MARLTTSSYVVTRRIYTEPWQADYINKKMDLGNRIYNNAVRHFKPIVAELRQDVWFRKNLALWKGCDDSGKELKKSCAAEISCCIVAYGLNEFDIHKYMGDGKRQSCPNGIGINIVQKLGTALSQSIRKAIFAGTEVHFRKYGHINSLEDKTATTGIIYKPESGTVSFMGMKLRLKPVPPFRPLSYGGPVRTRQVLPYCPEGVPGRLPLLPADHYGRYRAKEAYLG